MNEAQALIVAIEVPDVANLPDDQISEIAHMRDGRWSAQTKALLERLGTQKLDLNSGWAAAWSAWSCPCCRREKPQIARLSPGGALLCRLEFHHDHIGDLSCCRFSGQPVKLIPAFARTQPG